MSGEKKLDLISPNGLVGRADGPDDGEDVISTAETFPICSCFCWDQLVDENAFDNPQQSGKPQSGDKV
ncbi:CLUMA_CG007810, isoform A [Clunio marinus]|uniref:CLUMA_CG007810, isoform A n=1 Tax=Clunio marinus TaxID=568069 RepID=A0A1J1I1S7_9DIPT|nr:CLUMA_CG007810, isoform A [Clunio marinus]